MMTIKRKPVNLDEYASSSNTTSMASSSSSSSSPSPSSSAVTIPRPGKSILKRPPPPQHGFFSLARLSKLLPSQPQPPQQPPQAEEDDRTLKRAHFILPQLVTVYPISSALPPCTPTSKDERRSIERREAERRRRIVRGAESPNATGGGADEWWNMDKVESFYRECCEGREEVGSPAISAAFKRASTTTPRSLDLSGIQLNVPTAAILSDVFTIEWGLRKLVFRECDLDEHILKPILHALLIPASLTFLSLALNRRLKAPAYKLICAYVTRAKTLQFLDLSQNSLDKKSIEHIASSLTTGLESLKLDDCALRPAGLEALAHVVRTSSLRHISLRHNKITSTGAVAVALMIKDYPDTMSTTSTPTSTPTRPTNFTQNSPTSTPSPPQTPVLTSPSPSPQVPTRSAPLPLPPPRHPTTVPQTTYTPYVPRSKRGPANANVNAIQQIKNGIGGEVGGPLITSNAAGGVTTRHAGGVGLNLNLNLNLNSGPNGNLNGVNGYSGTIHGQQGAQGQGAQGQGAQGGQGQGQGGGPSVALMDKVRALAALPRLGCLMTLDLKGNEVRNGITYIGQVLKRNRTLKVLNLSENKLDVQGLVVVAEALKYNSCLETLDLSKNPCCGPGLEGIQSLRTAFTLNTALKRLFLSSTGMTPAGAIALAEFLPESTSLLHLDLTLNNLDLAGVMALSSGLKANHTMRCLDLNIPPGDEEMARMCRDILGTCIRNTEEARGGEEYRGSGRGLGKGVWGLIRESELAKGVRRDEEKKVGTDVVIQAYACKAQLEEQLSRRSASAAPSSPSNNNNNQNEVDPELIQKIKDIMPALTALIEVTIDPTRLEELLGLNDALMALMARSDDGRETMKGLGLEVGAEDVTLGRGVSSGNGDAKEEEEEEDVPATPRVDKGKGRAQPEPEEIEKVLSPTFLITESDEEDEEHARYVPENPEEELEMGMPSPTDRSRSWVEEEGEIFRKGHQLLGPEEMEGEYAGEDLRRELLVVEVQRPPPRPILDQFGMEIPQAVESTSPSREAPQEPKKPPPRPYIPRRSSTASTGSNNSLNSLSSLNTSLPPIASVASEGTATPSPSASVGSPLVTSPMSPSSPNVRSYFKRTASS